jgi:segregation and condensation protein B
VSTDLKRIVEAVLFAAETPLSLAQICQILETKDKAPVQTALAELSKEYDFLDRAFDLVEVAGGWRLRTRPEMAFWLRKLKRQSTTRLSRASLETLAIIAYKQPVLKAEIERIRGVEVSGVLRMLMEKDLVRVVGRKDLPGRPLIYGTTKRFLEVFDLKDLSDLPTLEEMQELLGEPDVVSEEDQDEAPLFTRGMAGQDDEEGGEEGDGEDGESAAEEEGAETAASEAEVQQPEPATTEVATQAESFIEQAQEQVEIEPVEQEPAPAYEQPESHHQAEDEPISPAMAEPVEQPPFAEQAMETTEQDVPHIEPKNEPEEPSGEGGPGGDPGPRAA